MGIWIELGVFVLALAFGLWQIHDVKKAREQTRRQREQEAASPGSGQSTGQDAPGQTGPSQDPSERR